MAEIELTGEVFEWRGPAPYYFLAVPGAESERLRAEVPEVSYGWGMVPVAVQISEVTWTTSLWPKDGRYLLPLKDAVRKAAAIALGDEITVTMRTAAGTTNLGRAELVDLVRRIQEGKAASEAQEEAWLAELARNVAHPRVVDLVLLGDPELGDELTAEQVVDLALAYRVEPG